VHERIDLIEEGLERGSFRRSGMPLCEPNSERIDILIKGSWVASAVGVTDLRVHFYDRMNFTHCDRLQEALAD
jgi:hypothetical protein